MSGTSGVRAPATRDQVDAYQYGLRRLEAALVRGDPVPLHEQIRSQRRAALAGVLIGILGLCAAAVLAAVAPTPQWERQTVVIGAGSGALYVVAEGPPRLVPVANLPAARLVLAALGRPDAATATPVTVPDNSLDAAPRTPTAALPGAVAVRTDTPVPPRWAVCDEVTPAGQLTSTTVIGGAAVVESGSPDDAVLLADPDGTSWLVTGGHRHRVDTGDGRLLAAFGLTGRVPRQAAPALLSLLPEGLELATPVVPGRGGTAPAGLPGRIGDVLVAHPVGGPERYYVVLTTGLDEVPAVVAELLRVASGKRAPLPIGAAELGRATIVDELPVDAWPAGAPRTREPADAPTVCWTWSADGNPAGDVWIGTVAPLPRDVAPVPLAQADGPGERIDAVAIGAGGPVHASAPGRAPEAGPLWLVSATGVAYGVADAATAAALGITAAEDAPEAALRLLPTGPTLALADAARVVDGLPAG